MIPLTATANSSKLHTQAGSNWPSYSHLLTISIHSGAGFFEYVHGQTVENMVEQAAADEDILFVDGVKPGHRSWQGKDFFQHALAFEPQSCMLAKSLSVSLISPQSSQHYMPYIPLCCTLFGRDSSHQTNSKTEPPDQTPYATFYLIVGTLSVAVAPSLRNHSR